MDKEDVVHIYNGILLSQKKRMNNAIEETWMDLEIITLSIINQTEKDKYHYDIAYVQNILKWYKWTYSHNRNKVTGMENLMVVKGEREG